MVKSIELGVEICDPFFSGDYFGVDFIESIFDFEPIRVAFLFVSVHELMNSSFQILHFLLYKCFYPPKIQLFFHFVGDMFHLPHESLPKLFSLIIDELVNRRYDVGLHLTGISIFATVALQKSTLLGQLFVVLVQLVIKPSYQLLSVLELLHQVLQFGLVGGLHDAVDFFRRVVFAFVTASEGTSTAGAVDVDVVFGSVHQSQLLLTPNTMKVVSSVRDHINWFPGHMKKALRLMEQNCHKVDVFVQVRDARIPYCSRNPEFDLIIKKNQKEKVIVFNKYDLCDQVKTDKIIKDYNEYGIRCFAVSSQKHDDMRRMLAYLKENYRHKYKQVGLWLMACGTPNVGKSSIINQLRSISDLQNKQATAKATASVCTTRGVSGFKILNNPLMFLMDTPGVMIPSVIGKELGLKMAVLGIIKDQIVDKEILLKYIMEQCQADNNDKYWKNLRIDKPSNSAQFLDSIRSKHKLYDYDAAYNRIIGSFRDGKLGNVTLDDPIIV